MTATADLAAALLKTPSLLNNLLSQIGGTLGQSDLFSNLLQQAETETASVQKLAPADTQNTQNQADAAAQTGAAQTAAASVSAAGVAGGDPASDSTADLLQKLGRLSSVLHNVLDALRQHNAGTGGKDGKQAANATDPDTAQDATAQTDATTVADASAAQGSGGDAQTLAGIVAELLALVQLMMHDLNALQGAGQAAQAAQTAQATDAVAATGTAAAAPQTPLAQLMALLEQAAKRLLPQSDAAQDTAPTEAATTADPAADAAATAANATAPADAMLAFAALADADGNSVTGAAGLGAQLTALDAELKRLVAALKKDLQAVQAAQTQKPAAATIAAAANVAVAPAAALDATASVATALAALPMPKTAPPPRANLAAQQAPQTAPQNAAPQQPADNQNAAAANEASALRDSATPQQNWNDDFSGNFAGQNNGASYTATGNLALGAPGVQAAGTYNFASQLSAIRAETGGATGLPSVVDQVILQMNRSVKSGDSTLSLQLQPADMGKITVKLDVSNDGKVQGTVTADNAKTLALLQKDSRSLERALQDAGLRADPGSLQFNLGQQPGNQAGQSAFAGAQAHQNNAGGAFAEGGDIAPLEAILPAETYYITPTGVNIQV